MNELKKLFLVEGQDTALRAEGEAVKKKISVKCPDYEKMACYSRRYKEYYCPICGHKVIFEKASKK